MSETFGVGDSAEKLNIGATVNADSKLHDDGSVTDKGETVFDPKEDKVKLIQKDGDLSDQAEAKDEDPADFDATSRTRKGESA
jgi:hypothetical protein